MTYAGWLDLVEDYVLRSIVPYNEALKEFDEEKTPQDYAMELLDNLHGEK